MPIMLPPDELSAADALVQLGTTNPFQSERAELERRALGQAYRAGDAEHNQLQLTERGRQLVESAQRALVAEGASSPADLERYDGLVQYRLRSVMEGPLRSLAQACLGAGLMMRRVTSYQMYREEAERLLAIPGEPRPLKGQLAHHFSLLFQQFRVQALSEALLPLGGSRAAEELRAGLWQAVFTRCGRRYERALYRQMHRLPVLIAGPPGTPKAALARIIALSGYVAFDAERLRFTGEPAMALRVADAQSGLFATEGLAPVALPGARPESLPPLRVEAAAPRGEQHALTVAERSLEPVARESHASVNRVTHWMLHHVDRLEPLAQAQLFAQLDGWLGIGVALSGDSTAPGLGPRVLTTCDVDLGEAVAEGRFREDLYHLLAAQRLELPALSVQLRQRPEDLPRFVADVLAPLLEGSELRAAAEEIASYIDKKLGAYPFPGNQRELARCARAVLLTGEYRPPARRVEATEGPLADLGRRFVAGDFDADGLLDAYCTLMYSRTGSYQESARRLGIDRRTVKSRVNEALLSELS